MAPWGMRTSPVRASMTAGFHIAFSRAALRVVDVAGDEVLAGPVDAVGAGLEADEVREVGVLLVVVGEERHVWSAKNSLSMTWPIAIASAPSVPGAGVTHSSANFTFSA